MDTKDVTVEFFGWVETGEIVDEHGDAELFIARLIGEGVTVTPSAGGERVEEGENRSEKEGRELFEFGRLEYWGGFGFWQEKEDEDGEAENGADKAASVDMIDFEREAWAERNWKSKDKVENGEKEGTEFIATKEAKEGKGAENNPSVIKAFDDDAEGVTDVAEDARDKFGKRKH